MLPRRDRAVADRIGVGDERRHAIGARRQMIDHAAVRGEQVQRIAQPLVVGRRGMPGEGVVAGRIVVLHGVGQRADQRHQVHPLGRLGKLLADLDIRAACGDRLQRRAILVRGARLHVEHVNMARAAPLEQEDHAFGPRAERRCLAPPRLGRPQQARQRQSQETGPTGPQERSPGEPDAAMEIGTSARPHGHLPRVVNVRWWPVAGMRTV